MAVQQQIHEPSQGAKYSLYYITAGSLVVIWSAIWYYWLWHSGVEGGDNRYYICTGLLLSGIAVLIIGVLVGRIGREGKNADVPVGNVTAAVVSPQGQANGAPAAAPVAPVAAPAPAAPAATVPRR